MKNRAAKIQLTEESAFKEAPYMYKVFIIEDDKIISGAVEKYLSGWGYEVRTASDFNNVLSEFADFGPHIILMDISLPFFNGFYWCSQIRKT